MKKTPFITLDKAQEIIRQIPPPFLLLRHEYLDIVLNAIQRDLLVKLF